MLEDGGHVYVIGATGAGKSTLLETLVAQDLHFGRGVALIDPHGDLADRVVNARYSGRITYLNVPCADGLGYNPLGHVAPEWRGLVAGGVLDVFKKAWSDAWGVRMEHILRNALLALLDQPRANLGDVVRLLRDERFRRTVAARVAHEPVRRFWQKEFYGTRDAIGPIENKVGAFLSDPLVYDIVCRPRRQISFRRIMDEGNALIVNLAKGRIGEDSASILGGLFVTTIGLAGYSRVDRPEGERRPFTLYIDEFQNYTTLAVAQMIAELRKYGVFMVFAHQYLDQLDPKVRHAVHGNVATTLCFRTSVKDAPVLGPQFAPRYRPSDLMLLRDREVLVVQMIEGCPQYPVKAVTLRPAEAFAEHRQRFLAEVAERKRARELERSRAQE